MTDVREALQWLALNLETWRPYAILALSVFYIGCLVWIAAAWEDMDR